MSQPEKPLDRLLTELQERAKELNCLYRVDEILSQTDKPRPELYRRIAEVLPQGWQYPDVARARLVIEGAVYRSSDFDATPWRQAAEVRVEGESVGEVAVYYVESRPTADEGPFLKEERRLIDTLADRIGHFITQRRLRAAHRTLEGALQRLTAPEEREWSVILEFLRRTDPVLLARITRKMINHLCWAGAGEAEELLLRFVSEGTAEAGHADDDNRPRRRAALQDSMPLAEETFRIAAKHCSEEEIVSCIHSWIAENKSGFLLEALEDPHSGLARIADALERFKNAQVRETELPLAVQKSVRVSLLRHFFTDRLDFINVAKRFVEIDDFHDLLSRMIYPSNSHGKLGGKSAGLFLATKIIRSSEEYAEQLGNVRTPRTWYISSDSLLEFIQTNNLEDLYNRKYLEIEQIRREYPHVVQVLKNSRFPPELTKGLAAALDDLEDRPLIVRSSSLLEDRTGAAFSGKYKSLFLANQGSKARRLEALQDAIAEVYASIFGPDPIEYRAERGLLDVHEEMGIMLQEVVGHRSGKYFLPEVSGVAFSNNEFRWSPRIRRKDGLVRAVPGLGTRAVDRLSDDYPVLLAPGQPGLRVNATPDEVIRYSPRFMDVINLESNAFETVPIEELFRACGDDFPRLRQLISIVEDGRIRRPSGLEPDWEKDDFAVTLEGLIQEGSLVSRIRALLKLLGEQLGTAVDIEFALDGDEFFLLQCRAQSYSEEYAPAAIPRNLPRDRIVFTADRYVANGRVPDITHIVYVDPEGYSRLGQLSELKGVGRAVGKLNQLLPKRQFVLLGPGRWGSRGDIKLGVGVTYSDINNTAVLLEIARKKGGYTPELSFGTHFFQDLVEADIRYLPLYPDEPGILFNERFLLTSRNVLPEILPEFAGLADTVRVIDVPKQTDGLVLRILMNADLSEAVGILTEPSAAPAAARPATSATEIQAPPEEHWRWRLRMAEKIAEHMDAARFGVKALYVYGSAKNATAGPASDLDLIVHFAGSEEQRRELQLWLDGWSRALAEVNYLRTGYRSDGLLDAHLVTDADIERRSSVASKIDAVTDAARPLSLRAREPA